MKYLRKFNEALSESELSKTEEELLKLFPHVRGRFTINPEDGKIDVDDDIIFSIQFNRLAKNDHGRSLKFVAILRGHRRLPDEGNQRHDENVPEDCVVRAHVHDVRRAPGDRQSRHRPVQICWVSAAFV